MSGDLLPGQALREISLAAELGISRNTLREALHQLATDGLIEQTLYKGASVRVLTREEVKDIYTIRRVLELQAVDRSPNARKSVLRELRIAANLGDQAYRSQNWKQYSTANLRFHQAIVALLGSKRINEFFAVILAQLRLVFSVAQDAGQFAKVWPPQNKEIYDLIAAERCSRAKKVLDAYLTVSERAALRAIQKSNLRRRVVKRPATMILDCSALQTPDRSRTED